MPAFSDDLLAFVISFIANFLSALVGGGSGLFLLPALLFIGVPFSSALASHKIATLGLGIGASCKHSKHAKFDLWLVLNLLFWGLPGVALGAYCAVFIPENAAKLILGLLILIMTVINRLTSAITKTDAVPEYKEKSRLIGCSGIFTIGVINGCLTSGSGLLFTLWLVLWFNMSYIRALSYTMLVCSLIYNLVGAAVLSTEVTLDIRFIIVLTAGALTGGYLGASLSLQRGEQFVKQAFTVASALIGSSLLIQGLLSST